MKIIMKKILMAIQLDIPYLRDMECIEGKNEDLKFLG